jgi:hypothetical protein
MGNGALANGPKLPRPFSTLPDRPFAVLQRFRQLSEVLCPWSAEDDPKVNQRASCRKT